MGDAGKKPSSELHNADAAGYSGALQPNLEKYRKYLDEVDLSDEAKDKWLRTLWHFMSTFVDLGWGVDPVQQVLRSRAEASAAVKKETVRKKKKKRSRKSIDRRAL